MKNHIVDVLSFEDAKKLFQHYNSNEIVEDSRLQSFFEFIGYNILVIKLTSATIANSIDLSLDKVFDYLESQQLDDLDMQIDINLEEDGRTVQIYTCLLDTLKQINLNANEQHVLDFLALLPSTDILMSDLVDWCGKEFEKENKSFYANVVNGLHAKGWIERHGSAINVHRIVQEVILYKNRQTNSPFVQYSLLIAWLIARFTEGFQADPLVSFRFLRYGESILKAIKEPYRHSIYQPLLALENEVLNVYNWLIVDEDLSLKWRGLVQRGENYLERTDPLLAVIYNNYGLAIGQQHQLDEALQYFTWAKAILDKKNVKAIPILLTVINNIAIINLINQNVSGFLDAIREANKTRRNHNLNSDLSLVLQYNALAIHYQNTSNNTKAIAYFEKALTLHDNLPIKVKNVFNKIQLLNNLAYNFFLNGKLDEAGARLIQAMDLFETLGHVRNKIMLLTIGTLIRMCEVLGMDEKAEKLQTI